MAGEVLADRGDPCLAKPFDEGAAVPPDERCDSAERTHPDDGVDRFARAVQPRPEGDVDARDGDGSSIRGGHPPRRGFVVDDPRAAFPGIEDPVAASSRLT